MKFKDTKVRINTNGFRILEYIDVLKKYKEYIDIVFSVDSLSKYICDVHFPKYLSQNVIEITRALRKNKISVRYNIVVTKLNECEVRELVQKAIYVRTKRRSRSLFLPGLSFRLKGENLKGLASVAFIY